MGRLKVPYILLFRGADTSFHTAPRFFGGDLRARIDLLSRKVIVRENESDKSRGRLNAPVSNSGLSVFGDEARANQTPKQERHDIMCNNGYYCTQRRDEETFNGGQLCIPYFQLRETK